LCAFCLSKNLSQPGKFLRRQKPVKSALSVPLDVTHRVVAFQS
jgi:hypothetical protein